MRHDPASAAVVIYTDASSWMGRRTLSLSVALALAKRMSRPLVESKPSSITAERSVSSRPSNWSCAGAGEGQGVNDLKYPREKPTKPFSRSDRGAVNERANGCDLNLNHGRRSCSLQASLSPCASRQR
jgi:hypothetical protein